MNLNQPTSEMLARATMRAQELRVFQGPPNEFWPACLETLAILVGGAEAVCLAVPAETAAGETAETVATRWRCAWELKTRPMADGRMAVLRGALRQASEIRTHAGGVWLVALTETERQQGGPGWLAALAFDAGNESPAVVFFLLPGLEAALVDDGLQRVRLVADLPRAYALQRQLTQARKDVETFASALDLVALLDSEKTFPAAAMTLCNEVAARHRCQRVSLSWKSGPYLRLRAISHMEKFEGRMTIVQLLEAAMEESADQDTEIVLPAQAESSLITRDHELYLAEQKSGNVVTLPLRVTVRDPQPGEEPLVVAGALTCERADGVFGEAELRHLRLAADHAARRLDFLERAEAWFGKRWLRVIRERLRVWLGAKHTLTKAAAIAGALLLLWALVWPMTFRVSAPFALRGADTAVISAPFEGYLAESKVEKGDRVAAGAVLATLDQTELALELSAAQADATRYERETQQARSERKLAEMQIAQARADQAKAKLEILKNRLELSQLRAPFEGVVVEGDLRERIGAPLKQGDALFRVAHLERMFAEVLVPEADVRYIAVGAKAELAFASQPGRRFPVIVERIEPLAQSKPEGNVFLVRCTLPAEMESWWRPGMSGAAKIEAGRRTPFWQVTRRTLDYLRLRWW